MSKAIPLNRLALNERGNNLLTLDGDVLFFAEVEPGLWFFAQYIQGNYPAFNTWFELHEDSATLAAQIQADCAGWQVLKSNLHVPVAGNGWLVTIRGEGEE